MNPPPPLAQLPVKSWATALSTYGSFLLFIVGIGLAISGLIPDGYSSLWLVGVIFCSTILLPHPDKIYISPEYLEVNSEVILLDEILWVKRSKFTLVIADHEGKELSIRAYYYPDDAISRLVALLERHVSIHHPLKLKTEVSANWWGGLFDWLFFVSAVILVLSFLGDMLMLRGAFDVSCRTISLYSLLGVIVSFYLRATQLRFCHSHLEIDDRKVLWSEITRVSSSLGFICIWDRWNCFYYFNPFNYKYLHIRDLQIRLQKAASSGILPADTPGTAKS